MMGERHSAQETRGIEQQTGELFGRLFPAYDEASFQHSVDLFARRFVANDFPLTWFRGKRFLDVGCGGGRYSIALAHLGAAAVTGVDVSRQAVRDARHRANDLRQVTFQIASAEALPFDDRSFDGVICSGVIHHLVHPVEAIAEIARVLRPGGMAYLLVYASGGLRWPMVQLLRPIAQSIGMEAMEEAVAEAELPVNKRRTYLDDLFVPVIDFYTWDRLAALLTQAGFARFDRWARGRLDHEENLEAYLADIEGFEALFRSGAQSHRPAPQPLLEWFRCGARIAGAVADAVRVAQEAVKMGALDAADAMRNIVGQGHHRVVAWKSG